MHLRDTGTTLYRLDDSVVSRHRRDEWPKADETTGRRPGWACSRDEKAALLGELRPVR